MPMQKVPSSKKRFQFLSQPHSVVLHHRDPQSYGGTMTSGENKQKRDSLRGATFFSAFGWKTKPRLSRRAAAGRMDHSISAHMNKLGLIHPDEIPREAKLQQDGPQSSLRGLLEMWPAAAFEAGDVWTDPAIGSDSCTDSYQFPFS